MKLKCPYCESEFDEKLAGQACSGCPLAAGCGKVKCPYCGEEFYPLPTLSRIFVNKRRS